MRFSLAAAALVPVLFAAAEDHLIKVGDGGKLVFNPPNITAQIGDNVVFQFQGKNHSVTQSTLATPCAPQTVPAQGVDSGFQFVNATDTELPEWSFTVDNATSPLWFYCAQTIPADHCQMGMVFSINAPVSGPKSYATFQANAMNGAAAGGAAASGASSIISGAIAGATDAAGAAGGAASSIASAAQGAATDAANAISNAVSGATGLLGGGSNPAPTNSASGNGTAPNAGVRVGGSAMSLVAAIGLAAGLLL